MPQLALETYISQYFWLLVIFFGFYWLSITQILPRIALLMKSRNKISELSILDSLEQTSIQTDKNILEGDIKYEIVSEKSYKKSTSDVRNKKWSRFLKKWLAAERSRKNKKTTISKR